MKIYEEHLREPGLVVVDITAADEATATQAVAALGGLWLSSGPSAPWHTPGQASSGTRSPPSAAVAAITNAINANLRTRLSAGAGLEAEPDIYQEILEEVRALSGSGARAEGAVEPGEDTFFRLTS
ncbi:DUF6207 family protein [Streptomyces decoyicus]